MASAASEMKILSDKSRSLSIFVFMVRPRKPNRGGCKTKILLYSQTFSLRGSFEPEESSVRIDSRRQKLVLLCDPSELLFPQGFRVLTFHLVQATGTLICQYDVRMFSCVSRRAKGPQTQRERGSGTHSIAYSPAFVKSALLFFIFSPAAIIQSFKKYGTDIIKFLCTLFSAAQNIINFWVVHYNSREIVIFLWLGPLINRVELEHFICHSNYTLFTRGRNQQNQNYARQMTFDLYQNKYDNKIQF